MSVSANVSIKIERGFAVYSLDPVKIDITKTTYIRVSPRGNDTRGVYVQPHTEQFRNIYRHYQMSFGSDTPALKRIALNRDKLERNYMRTIAI